MTHTTTIARDAAKAAYDANPTPSNRLAYERAVRAWWRADMPDNPTTRRDAAWGSLDLPWNRRDPWANDPDRTTRKEAPSC